MPRQAQTVIETNFIKGLITEATALKSDPSSCTETFDCVFDFTGKVSRRLGIEYEDSYALNSVTKETNEIFTEYLWTSVGGLGTISFAVVQQGSTLRFYDASNDDALSANPKSFTVDLTDYLPSTGTRDPALFRCDFAQGSGRLIVVNEACDPFYIEYDATGDTIAGTAITLLARDFEGLDDGLGINDRPADTVAGIKSSNPEHYYNLINQGWYIADALAQWDTARADLPSNADTVPLYRSLPTDAFDNLLVVENSPGNTPAPKGHFILEVGAIDRGAALSAEGFTGVTIGSSTPEISKGTGTVINAAGMTNPSFAFDNNQASYTNSVGTSTSTYVGKNLGASATQISKAIIHAPSSGGYQNGGTASMTATLYGKNGSAPSSSTDGTSLGTITFTNLSDEHVGRTITSGDLVTVYQYVWVRFSTASAVTWVITEIELYSSDPTTTFYRPTATAFLAGRAWFGGINSQDLSSNIYFSQIIETKDQFNKCYQANDPTSEFSADLLPNDGGVIKIPEMATLVRLVPLQNSLMALATNGVWLIGGSGGNQFQANDYVIQKLSPVGTNSPMSLAMVQGIPYWWTDTDIYTAAFDPSYGTYQVKPVTTTTISTFLTSIPTVAHTLVKGVYNRGDFWVYWLYNSEGDVDYTYDAVLVLNTITGAFYPWTIGDGAPEVRGLLVVSTPTLSTDPAVKLLTTIDAGGGLENITFSEFSNDHYVDWDIAGAAVDYTSYAITGYRISGEANKNFQSNYVSLFFDAEDDASCFVQGRFDFTSSGTSGRWSTVQQVYPSQSNRNTNRAAVHSRRKIRGSGPALQLKFESESGKPFTLLGYTIWETGNAAT